MNRVCVGISLDEQPWRLHATLAALRTADSTPFDLCLVADGPDAAMRAALQSVSDLPRLVLDEPRGAPTGFNRLALATHADVLVWLEGGVRVGPGWLVRLLAALDTDPRNGLAGPSTNRAWNEQGMFPGAGDSPAEIARAAAEAARRFGSSTRTLEPLYSLGDFCYVVRRAVIDAVGPADEGYGLGPCWEMDYNARAARAGFRGVWAGGAYVHRAPFTARRAREEPARFDASRRRYQDKFCGARLRGAKSGYRDHCRGDACPNFAPVVAPTPIQIEPVAGPPLVSCLMPTCDRRPFVARAARLFLAQDYPNKELVVVDDGRDAVADALPDDRRIRYVRLGLKENLGAKRNRACAEARGEFLVHWDDDDWYPEHRIRSQVHILIDGGHDVCGSSRLYFLNPAAGRAWLYHYTGGGRPWLAGSTLAYRARFWSAHRFAEVQVGEDARFVWSAASGRVRDMADPGLCVATLHPGNTARKDVGGAYWHAIDPAPVRALIGEDSPITAPVPLVSCIMPTGDRRPFVELALRAFDQQDYPRRELVIVDDGREPIDGLIAGRADVRTVRPGGRLSIGEKRNLACREAQGELIAHWDDDDWYAPHRLSYQLAPLVAGAADLVGLVNAYTLDLAAGRFFAASPQLHRRMFYADVHGGSIAFRRSLLDRGVSYPSASLAEDAALIRRAMQSGGRLARLENPGAFVYVRHGRNTWQLDGVPAPGAAGWAAVDPPPGFTESDLAAYRAASDTVAALSR